MMGDGKSIQTYQREVSKVDMWKDALSHVGQSYDHMCVAHAMSKQWPTTLKGVALALDIVMAGLDRLLIAMLKEDSKR